MAISSAFRSGHIGVMDYYRMKNINADSEMKTSIAHSKALGYTEE